jgi:5-methyltetrahydrofolate--homocysteine methyltransferase
VIHALGKAGVRERVEVIVGGAPVSKQFARKIRPDGYAEDTGVAVEIAKKLMGK